MGFCGTLESHKCVHDFQVLVSFGEEGYNKINDAFDNGVKSNYARVLMANPLHKSLPAFLLVAMATCNRFSAEDIREQWNRVEQLWREHCLELVGPIIGHASDGDSRRRSVQLADYYRRDINPSKEF